MRCYVLTTIERKRIVRHLTTHSEKDIGKLVKSYRGARKRIKADLVLLERLLMTHETKNVKTRLKPDLYLVGNTVSRKL